MNDPESILVNDQAGASQAQGAEARGQAKKPVVFLAWTTEDIGARRADFGIMLQKAGYEVLALDERYETDQELRDKTEAYVRRADFAVIMLGGEYGRTLHADSSVSHTRYQYEVAIGQSRMTGGSFKVFFWQLPLEGLLLLGEQQELVNFIQNHLTEDMMFSNVNSASDFIQDLKGFLERIGQKEVIKKEYDLAFISNIQDAADCYETIEKLSESLRVTTLTVVPESEVDYKEEAQGRIIRSRLTVIYFKESSDWAISFVKQMWKVVGGASSNNPFLLIGEDEPRRNRFLRFRAPQILLEVVKKRNLLSAITTVHARVAETGRITETSFCPYTGLRPFNEDESIFFKGRERHVDTILRMLGEEKFVMVTGSSGDGKSSLIFAGLVPSLKGGFLSTSFSKWAVADFRPERQPLRNLSIAIGKELRLRNPDEVESALSYGFSALVDLYKKSDLYCDVTSNEYLEGDEETRKMMRRQAANLLILVDQFEEFFTNTENYRDGVASPTAQITVNVLLETIRIARQEGLPVYVVFTMRSDFIGQCVAFRGFAELIGNATYFVPRLKREEIQEVIDAPAYLNGNRLSVRLSQRILNDLGDGLDQLPVLQHALHQIWTQADAGKEELDLIHYAKVGGLAELKLPRAEVEDYQRWFSKLNEETRELYAKPALRNILNRHANLLYAVAHEYYNARHDDKITKEEAQEVIRYAFTGLTKIDENRAVRNRMTLEEIADLIGNDEVDYLKVGRVLNIFREPGNTFIQPYIDPEKPEPYDLAPSVVLDITHEALIRNWDKLIEWAEREHKRVATYADVKVQLNRWLDHDCRPKYLLNRGTYSYFSTWYEDTRPTTAWIRRYIAPEEILPEMDVTEQAELYLEDLDEFLLLSQEKLERQRRAAIFALVVILALLLAAIAMTIFALQQAEIAKEKEQLAIAQKTEVDNQRKEAERQKTLAELQRAKADRQTLIAEINLLQAKMQEKVARRERITAEERKRYAEKQKALAEENARIALLRKKEAEESARVAQEQTEIAELQRRKAEEALEEARVQRNSAQENQSRFLANLTEEQVQQGQYELGLLIALRAMPETIGGKDSRPYVAEAEGALYNAADRMMNNRDRPENMLLGHTNKVVYNQFSPDGKYLITTSMDKTARLWDLSTNKLKTTYYKHTHIVDNAVFSRDGRQVVTLAEDFTARLWALEAGREVAVFRGHADLLTSAALSADGRRVATASKDKTALLFGENGGRIAVLQGHTEAVLHVAFNPQGTRLVTTGADGMVKLWEAEGGTLLADMRGHGSPVTFATFSPDGSMVVTTSEDKTAIIWDGVNGNIRSRLKGHEAAVLHAAFSADNKKVVTSSTDFSSKVWSTANGKMLGELKGVGAHGGPVYHAEFSSTGKHILTSSDDHTARLWDARSYVHLATYDGHDANGYYAVFSPDGSKIAMSVSRFPRDPRFSIQVYKVLPDRQELLDYVRKNLKKRDLTQTEKDFFFLQEDLSLEPNADVKDNLDGTLLDTEEELESKDRLDPVRQYERRPRFHRVQEGESLFIIARKYGMDVSELKALNRLTSNELKVGQKLLLKAK
ncbi:MAG: LysM peptidoglycan-binding domain-containing protein [Bacteroidetes bacterium]|jgi:WD40 repeat protein|nr:LysM peptidoglycan-binding domain-containing protein [Bacteroidota bacterium]